MNWMLYIAVAFLPFYDVAGSVTVGEAEISPFDGLVMLLFFFSLMLLPLKFGRIRWLLIDYLVVLWCLINFSVLLLTDAGAFYKSLNSFRYYVAIPVALYFLVRFYCYTPKEINRLCSVILISTTLMAVAGVVEFLSSFERIQTTVGGPHAGAIVMLGGIGCAVYLRGITNRAVVRLLISVCTIFLMVAITLTMARALIAATLVIPPVVWYLFSRFPAMNRLFFVGLFLFGLLIPFGFIGYAEQHSLSRSADENLNRLTDVKQLESGVGVRVSAYVIALKYIGAKPFLGHGNGVYDRMAKDGLYLAHVHNVVLEILLRVGVIGLLVFVFITHRLVSLGSAAYRRATVEGRRVLVVFFSLIAVVLVNGFTNNIANLVSNSALWLYMALAGSGAAYWRFSDRAAQAIGGRSVRKN